MGVSHFIDGDTGRSNSCQPEVEKAPAPEPADELPRFVRTEANLLRLPLFALHTKRLKTLDGIECRGRVTRNGETHQFVFRATRNTATLYPGPLARSAHLALLSILTERGFPQVNPLTWSWRELCRRMGIVYGGQIVSHLKDSLTATAALLISSEHALYSKPDGKPIRTAQDALHLYDRVVFVGGEMPDGTTADTNYLWLSDWYLQNLNALFTAPLDYPLWRRLDEKSPIASRLYEFLLLNFYTGTPVLRINYETLAQFLPVRPERYLSDARRQMESAFQLLADNSVIAEAQWRGGKNTLSQLHLFRGSVLSRSAADTTQEEITVEEIADTFKVKEIRNLRPPEWQLVSSFYQLWTGQENYRPTKKELEQASAIIAAHGPAKAAALIPPLIKRLKEKWPDAKTFGAISYYLPEITADYERAQHRTERERQEKLREAQEEAQREASRKQLYEQWKPAWDALAETDREEIQRSVLEKSPFVAKTPSILERFCLLELSRRQTVSVAGDT